MVNNDNDMHACVFAEEGEELKKLASRLKLRTYERRKAQQEELNEIQRDYI